jgi:hypothetical protein
MDSNDVEKITFNALGGADNAVVNDLSGTDVTEVSVNLAVAGYALDLSPGTVNGDLKGAVGQVPPRDRDAMKAATGKWLHRCQQQPAILAAFFNKPHVR